MAVSDTGPETKDITEYLLRKYRMRHVQISAYNSKVNRLVKVGHKPVIYALRKLTKGTGQD